MNIRRICFASLPMSFAIVLLMPALNAGPARANSVVLTDTSGAKWKVQWSNALHLDIEPIQGATGKDPNYTITESLDWTKGADSASFNITSTQQAAPTMENPFGLRITLNQNIKNDTTARWVGFSDTLVEDKQHPVTLTGQKKYPANDDHPYFAHWHRGTVSAPFVFSLSNTSNFPAFPTPGTGSAVMVLPKDGQPLLSGDSFTVTGLGLHERTFSDTDPPDGKGRQFTLVQTYANPEPSSIILMGLGLTGVVGYMRRRRRWAHGGREGASVGCPHQDARGSDPSPEAGS
jgi:hypothetical protein